MALSQELSTLLSQLDEAAQAVENPRWDWAAGQFRDYGAKVLAFDTSTQPHLVEDMQHSLQSAAKRLEPGQATALLNAYGAFRTSIGCPCPPSGHT